jgi:hypothetical protein
MMSSKLRAEFAKSLPQEVLSELVIAMSSQEGRQPGQADDPAAASGAQRRSAPNAELDEAEGRPAKKRRASDDGANGANGADGTALAVSTQNSGRKPGHRVSLPSGKPGSKPGPKRRTSAAAAGNQQFSSNQKLNFCADLLTRMLSGPGNHPLPHPPLHHHQHPFHFPTRLAFP